MRTHEERTVKKGDLWPLSFNWTLEVEVEGRTRGMVYGRRTRHLSEFEKPSALLYQYTLRDITCANNRARLKDGLMKFLKPRFSGQETDAACLKCPDWELSATQESRKTVQSA